MNRRLHQSIGTVSHANEALERDGYAVVPDALDDEGVERLRLTFDRAPKQSGGTQHIEISDETPEVGLGAPWNIIRC